MKELHPGTYKIGFLVKNYPYSRIARSKLANPGQNTSNNNVWLFFKTGFGPRPVFLLVRWVNMGFLTCSFPIVFSRCRWNCKTVCPRPCRTVHCIFWSQKPSQKPWSKIWPKTCSNIWPKIRQNLPKIRSKSGPKSGHADHVLKT